MKNLVSIIEIPVEDLHRAISFYQAVFQLEIEEASMGDTKLGVFPAEEGKVNLVLIKGEGYIPSTEGPMLYFTAEGDLDLVLERITVAGGQVVVSKTEISPEMGFYALFMDTEGNRLALHGES